jgi:hypothetical protein
MHIRARIKSPILARKHLLFRDRKPSHRTTG